MSSLLAAAYPWIKSLHVISVIAWMAGLLYLPRLFVYHTRAAPGSETSETFKTMEEKLVRVIMTPAMVASLVFGLLLLATPGIWANGGVSLHAKLVLVAGLLWMHFALVRWRHAFAEDRNEKSERFFRVVNEVPTLLMIGIVILIIARPF